MYLSSGITEASDQVAVVSRMLRGNGIGGFQGFARCAHVLQGGIEVLCAVVEDGRLKEYLPISRYASWHYLNTRVLVT